ncbi:MAG: XRE family transcriptional regulator [Proteobacteria bacterium]|nr:XRE family transcriptional regulator [Pseudomonadota bacterium]
MADPKTHLSQKLKELRKKRSWSLDKAAAHTGVSKAMLGQIERRESYPTTAILWKIATGFEVSISSLIEAVPQTETDTLIRTAEEVRQNRTQDGLNVAPLFPHEARFGFEYMELTFEGGYGRRSDPHEPGVVEFLTVVDGELDVMADDRWHRLKAGQSIRFRGDKVHGYRNPTNKKTTTMLIIHYPEKN